MGMWYETPPPPDVGPAGTFSWTAPVHPASALPLTGSLPARAKGEEEVATDMRPPPAVAPVRHHGSGAQHSG